LQRALRGDHGFVVGRWWKKNFFSAITIHFLLSFVSSSSNSSLKDLNQFLENFPQIGDQVQREELNVPPHTHTHQLSPQQKKHHHHQEHKMMMMMMMMMMGMMGPSRTRTRTTIRSKMLLQCCS
jgi:hypothetical protein